MPELVWHDGQIFPPEDARCSCLDRGRLYGDGLFETMRAYSGQVFRLDAHLARLMAGSKQIYLRLSMATEAVGKLRTHYRTCVNGWFIRVFDDWKDAYGILTKLVNMHSRKFGFDRYLVPFDWSI